jgi:YVTN family beta-propeller protein
MKKTICLFLFTLLLSLVVWGNSWALPFAYIPTAWNKLTVIDTATDTVIATVPIGTSGYGVAVKPSGTRVYLSGGDVSVISTISYGEIARVPAGTVGMAVNPSGTRVYVANINSNTVSVIDTTTNTVTATVEVGAEPFGVAINPAGTRVYVTNHSSGTVSVIDTATNTVTATVGLYFKLGGTAVNPSGTKLYVTTEANTVSVIDTVTNTVTASVAVDLSPFNVAVNPSGTRAYVTTKENLCVIDTETNTVIARVPVVAPWGVAVNPSGTKVYATGATVSVIDTASNIRIKEIPLEGYAVALGHFIGPDWPPGFRWAASASFNIKFTSLVKDASGNLKFENFDKLFTGTIEYYRNNEGLMELMIYPNGESCYAKFLGDDGTMSLCIERIAFLYTDVQGKKKEDLIFKGTGDFSAIINGMEYTGIAYLDAEGKTEKGGPEKVMLKGEISGGSDLTIVFSGGFQTALTAFPIQ